MLKWILATFLIFGGIGYFIASSNYTPISKQIDVKTMSITKPDFIVKTWDVCTGNCTNYSSSSSSSSWGGGGSLGGK